MPYHIDHYRVKRTTYCRSPTPNTGTSPFGLARFARKDGTDFARSSTQLRALAYPQVTVGGLLRFVIALFEKGFTHDLLLEAGVFLVSVKLVIMSYKANTNIATLDSQLITMTTSLQRIERLLRPDPPSDSAPPASS